VNEVFNVEPVGGHEAVVADGGQSVSSDLSNDACGCVGEHRAPGGDEPDVVEERPAEGRVEEIVAQRVLPRLGRERQVGRVVEAHHQPLGVAHRGVLVHLPAVDLDLFLIEPVHEVGGIHVGRDVLLDAERCVGEVGRELRARRLRQGHEGGPGQVHLSRGHGVGQAVGSGELTVEVVETVILQIDDDNVLELLEARNVRPTSRRRSGRSGAGRGRGVTGAGRQ
jgi:hypothetical protein